MSLVDVACEHPAGPDRFIVRVGVDSHQGQSLWHRSNLFLETSGDQVTTGQERRGLAAKLSQSLKVGQRGPQLAIVAGAVAGDERLLGALEMLLG